MGPPSSVRSSPTSAAQGYWPTIVGEGAESPLLENALRELGLLSTKRVPSLGCRDGAQGHQDWTLGREPRIHVGQRAQTGLQVNLEPVLQEHSWPGLETELSARKVLQAADKLQHMYTYGLGYEGSAVALHTG